MARKKKLFAVPSWIPWIGKQDKRGREILDPSPVAMPLGVRRPERLEDQIARLVKSEMFRANSLGDDTIEEAMDFDVDDDLDPTSPFETEWDENLGREITPQEWASNREHFMEVARTRLRNQARLEERFADLEEAYQARRQRAREANRGGDGGNPPPVAKPPSEPS